MTFGGKELWHLEFMSINEDVAGSAPILLHLQRI